MTKITINAMGTSYPIHIGTGLINAAGKIISSLAAGSKALIVTDSNVAKIYANVIQKSLDHAGIKNFTEVIVAGENSKNLANIEILLDVLAAHKMTRSDIIIALGGGVIGDLAGFAASIYLRGIPFIQIPTTLLAQVDSSVGGKVGINISHGKNLAGSFYQPIAVIIDTDCLKTLPDKELAGGMAEVAKYGAIYDTELFNILAADEFSVKNDDCMKDIIARCCAIKGKYVEKDPYDKGIRMQLNFGHTMGHAVEKLSGYGTYHHGEAVAMGMVAAALWGEHRGITETGTSVSLIKLLKKLDLPVNLPEYNMPQMLDAFKLDKKNISSRLNFIFLEKTGKAVVHPIEAEELCKWLAKDYSRKIYE